MELFDVFANRLKEWLVTMTRTFPELDQVIVVHDEEPSKFFGNGSRVYLGWIDRKVKDKSCYIDRVSDDNDFQKCLPSFF